MSESEFEGGPEGMGITIPIGAMMAQAHDRAHLEAVSMIQRIYAFLDSLNVEQLLCLKKILQADGKSYMNNYFEGQVVTLLRMVHNVDPDTGLTVEQALAADQEATERREAANPE